MHARRAIAWLFIPVMLAIPASLIIFKIIQADSDPNVVDWFNGTPTVKVLNDTTEQQDNLTGVCTDTTLQVMRGTTPVFQNTCMVQTKVGLMSQLYANQGVYQPSILKQTYPVAFAQGGNPIITPLPNQVSGLYFRASSLGGFYLGMYDNLLDAMTLNQYLAERSYSLDQDSPDWLFRYANGESIRFTGSYAISADGTYVLAEIPDIGLVRIDLEMHEIKPYSGSLPSDGSAGFNYSRYAVNGDGSVAASAYGSPETANLSLKFTDVDGCGAIMPEAPDVINVGCREVHYENAIRSLYPTARSISNVRFANDTTIVFDVMYDASGTQRYVRLAMTAPGQQFRAKQYLALGDSYSSGEGAGSYRAGTDTGRNKCHQSTLSYPYLLSASQSSFASLACSGAVISNVKEEQVNNKVRSDQLEGDEPPADQEKEYAESIQLPGYIAQNVYVSQDNPEAITISIGGNDIGFADIIKRCVSPLSGVADGFSCFGSYEDRLEVAKTVDAQFIRLRGLYAGLMQAGTGGRRVYVVGYPQIIKPDGDCGLNVAMNRQEIEFGRDLITHLNAVIKKSADEAGVMYVDVSHTFDGYRLCEAASGQAAVNGLTISRTASGGYDIKASYHPNQRGHQLLANAVADQTDNLTKPMPGALPRSNQAVTADDDPILQGVPKTGRPLRQLITAADIVPATIAAASALPLDVPAAGYYLKPSTSYNLAIGNNPASIGNAVSDAAGNLHTSVVLPTGTPVGYQPLHVYGNDIFGNPVDITQVIFVQAAAGDSDGDGLPDTADSCPLLPQSGSDADKDGIDDVCDPAIGPPPADTPNEPDGIVWWSNAVAPIDIQAVSGP